MSDSDDFLSTPKHSPRARLAPIAQPVKTPAKPAKASVAAASATATTAAPATATAAAAAAAAPAKPRPGRPRKQRVVDPTATRGVVAAPANDANALEFTYAAPGNFRKAVSVLNSFHAKHATLEFRPERFAIYADDRTLKCAIRAEIDVRTSASYYYAHTLGDVLRLELKVSDLHRVMSTVRKPYVSVTFALNAYEMADARDRQLAITFRDDEVDSDVNHNITCVVRTAELRSDDTFSFADYPLHIQFTGVYFKRLLSDLREFTDDFDINYVHTPRPRLTIQSNKDIPTSHVYSKIGAADKVRVECTGQDDIYATTVKLGYILPLETGFVPDAIVIHAHQWRNMLLQIPLDAGFDMRISVDIVSFS